MELHYAFKRKKEIPRLGYQFLETQGWGSDSGYVRALT